MQVNSHPTDMSDDLERKVAVQAEELRSLRAQLEDVLRRVVQLESRGGTRRSALPQRQTSASSLRSESPPVVATTPVNQSQPTVQGSLSLSKRWSSTGDFNQHRPLPGSGSRLASAKSLFNLHLPRSPAPAEAEWDAGERVARVRGLALFAPGDLRADPAQVAPPPARRLQLRWVDGYRGRDCRSNLHLLPTGETVYFSACVVVLHGLSEGTQRHYQGHTDAVLCLCVHPNRLTLASGQGGTQPHVRVWDSVSLATLACVGLGHFDAPIRCVGFSKADGGGVLCAVDDGLDHVLSLWSWQRGSMIAHAKSSCEAVTWAEFHPLDGALVTAGKSHLAFWTAHGDTLFKMAATFEARARPKFVTAIAFSQSGAVISGDSSGNVTLWARGGALSSRSVRSVHSGAVLSLLALKDGRVLSGGGKDGRLVLLDEQLRVLTETALPGDVGGVRAAFEGRAGRITVGTTRNCILHGPLERLEVVVRSHADGVLSLAAHPSRSELAGAGLDGLLIARDSQSHEELWRVALPDACHSLSWAPDGESLLAGLAGGRWVVVATGTGGGANAGGGAGDAPLTSAAFSPDGTHMALGSADGSVYVQSGPRWDRVGRCLGHSAAVTAIDWSSDGEMLRTNSANSELLFWTTSTCRQAPANGRARDALWASARCSVSFDSLALAGEGGVASADARGALLAAGDAGGRLRLFAFPCQRAKALSHAYSTHSGPVAAVTFLPDNATLVTAGSQDCSVLTWALV